MGFIRDVRKGLLFLRRCRELTAEERALIDATLTEAERELFFRMDQPDQIHSVHVARCCAQALPSHPEVAAQQMMKAALLHDVGKIGANLGLVFRTLWVLGHRLLPWMLDWIANCGGAAPPGSLWRKMHTQLHHAAIGAQMLRAAGTEEAVCRLVASTGEQRRRDDPPEKRLLLAADADWFLGAPSIAVDTSVVEE